MFRAGGKARGKCRSFRCLWVAPFRRRIARVNRAPDIMIGWPAGTPGSVDGVFPPEDATDGLSAGSYGAFSPLLAGAGRDRRYGRCAGRPQRGESLATSP